MAGFDEELWESCVRGVFEVKTAAKLEAAREGLAAAKAGGVEAADLTAAQEEADAGPALGAAGEVAAAAVTASKEEQARLEAAKQTELKAAGRRKAVATAARGAKEDQVAAALMAVEEEASALKASNKLKKEAALRDGKQARAATLQVAFKEAQAARTGHHPAMATPCVQPSTEPSAAEELQEELEQAELQVVGHPQVMTQEQSQRWMTDQSDQTDEDRASSTEPLFSDKGSDTTQAAASDSSGDTNATEPLNPLVPGAAEPTAEVATVEQTENIWSKSSGDTNATEPLKPLVPGAAEPTAEVPAVPAVMPAVMPVAVPGRQDATAHNGAAEGKHKEASPPPTNITEASRPPTTMLEPSCKRARQCETVEEKRQKPKNAMPEEPNSARDRCSDSYSSGRNGSSHADPSALVSVEPSGQQSAEPASPAEACPLCISCNQPLQSVPLGICIWCSKYVHTGSGDDDDWECYMRLADEEFSCAACALDHGRPVCKGVAEEEDLEVAEEEDLEWQTAGHRWLNQRVVRVFDKQHIEGTVTGWLPPNPNDATEPALFHIRHNDGMCSFALLIYV